MLTRISNLTSFEHVQDDGDGHAVTNICFHWQGGYYTSRVLGHLTPPQVEVEEERFLERRHRRRA